MFVRRDANGKVDGVFPIQQTFAMEELPDNHPDILAFYNPTQESDGVIDLRALNAALAEPGSVVRALGLIMFDEINKLRVKNGDAAYTLTQFKNALIAKMR